MGRTLYIEKTKPRESREGGFTQNGGGSGEFTTCFIGNLSFYATEDGIRQLFESCGDIKDVRIAKN